MKDIITGVLFGVIVLMFILFMSSTIGFLLDRYRDEDPIKVMKNSRGEFICKMRGSYSIDKFKSYNEAMKECLDWNDDYMERMGVKNDNWKEVKE